MGRVQLRRQPLAPIVLSITAENGAPLAAYQLEPQLITALSEDKNRTKRRIVTYNEIPPQLVQAVVAIEDRRFFEHGGVNYVRMTECVVHDIMAGRKECGGSTLTQQLAKDFFLTPEQDHLAQDRRADDHVSTGSALLQAGDLCDVRQ